jgi:hypothetical protein
MVKIKELSLWQKIKAFIHAQARKHFDVFLLSCLPLRGKLYPLEMQEVRVCDIPFQFEETKTYLQKIGYETLWDVVARLCFSYDLLQHAKIFTDILDTLKNEYNEDPLRYDTLLNEYKDTLYRSPYTGFLEVVQETVSLYRELGMENTVMPEERFCLCCDMWWSENKLDFIMDEFNIVKGYKSLQEDVWEKAKEYEAEWKASVKAVENWDKEHYWNLGKMYV